MFEELTPIMIGLISIFFFYFGYYWGRCSERREQKEMLKVWNK